MRTIPEENLTDNQLEMSFETLRGSDGEDLASGRTSRTRSSRHVFCRVCPWDQTKEIINSTKAQRKSPWPAGGDCVVEEGEQG